MTFRTRQIRDPEGDEKERESEEAIKQRLGFVDKELQSLLGAGLTDVYAKEKDRNRLVRQIPYHKDRASFKSSLDYFRLMQLIFFVLFVVQRYHNNFRIGFPRTLVEWNNCWEDAMIIRLNTYSEANERRYSSVRPRSFKYEVCYSTN